MLRFLTTTTLACSLIPQIAVAQIDSNYKCREEYRSYAYNYWSILKWVVEFKEPITSGYPICIHMRPNEFSQSDYIGIKNRLDEEFNETLSAYKYLLKKSDESVSTSCQKDQEMKNHTYSKAMDAVQKKSKDIQDRYADIFKKIKTAKRPVTNSDFNCDFIGAVSKNLISQEDQKTNFLYQAAKGHSAIVVSENWDKEKSFEQFEDALQKRSE